MSLNTKINAAANGIVDGIVSPIILSLQSLPGMYLSWEGEYIQTGCWEVLGGTRQGQDSAPPGSSTASRVPWGLSLCCAGELSTCQRTLSMGQNSSGAVIDLEQRAVWQPWGLQWLGWGTRDPGWCSWQSSWKAQLGTSNTPCSLQLSVTGGAGYNPFFFFFSSTIHSTVL